LRHWKPTILIFLFLANHSAALGCECAYSSYPAREAVERDFKGSDLVFSGTVKSMEMRFHWVYTGLMLNKREMAQYLVVSLAVKQIFKGPKQSTIIVTTGSGGASSIGPVDCAFPFRLGETYIVYAYSKGDETERLPSTSICLQTKLLANAAADLRYIRGEPPAKEDLLDLDQMDELLEKRADCRICGKVAKQDGSLVKTGRIVTWIKQGNDWRYSRPHSTSIKDGNYCARMEPGTYIIGAFIGNREEEPLIGFWGDVDRMELSIPIQLKAGETRKDVDIVARQRSKFRVKGKIKLSGIQRPSGTITMETSNDWDWNFHQIGIVGSDGSFEIKNVYPGRLRLIPSLKLENLSDAVELAISVPELQVPGEAGNVTVTIKKETLPERATRESWAMWGVVEGDVIAVNEGDKIEVRSKEGEAVKIRLKDIDTPDPGQPFAEQAREFCSSLLLGKHVVAIIPKDEKETDPLQYDDGDDYFVAQVLIDGKHASDELLQAGMAWQYKKFSVSKKYDQLEQSARKARIGIWSESNPIPPWEFRKR